MICAEQVVEMQLAAYNNRDYDAFASYYHKDITSVDLQSNTASREMSGEGFFSYYRNKFLENPNIHCSVTNRIILGNLVVDEEVISDYRSQEHKEFVIYQVDDGLITKMWFTQEIPLTELEEEPKSTFNCN